MMTCRGRGAEGGFLQMSSDIYCLSSYSFTLLEYSVAKNHLGSEVFSCHGRIVLTVTSHVASADFFDRHIFDVEAHIVTGESFRQRLMVHLHRLHFSSQVGGSKCDYHTGLQDTRFHSPDRYSSNSFEGRRCNMLSVHLSFTFEL